MRFKPILLLLIMMVQVTAHHSSLRAIPAAAQKQRRRLIPIWPYAFLVSHVGFTNNQSWCITAKHGTTDGSDVGFDLCHFSSVQDNQLFLLDGDGKMHSKLDPTQCLVVDEGSRTTLGGARVKFCACNEPGATYNTFEHNRDTDVIRVKDDPDCCIKQTGNGPDASDTIRTEMCDETNACFIYDYVEYNCVADARWNDVDCCDNDDCTSTEICKDYSCRCSTSLPGVDCCNDADCPSGFCDLNSNLCTYVAPTLPPLPSWPRECMTDADCPTDYDCEEYVCMKPAIFLASEINNQDYCVSANRGIGEFQQVGSEPCDFTNKPLDQLWHEDLHHKIRSDLDKKRCLIVGEGTNIFTGVQIHIASCNINTFLYDSTTDRLHLGEDQAYCLTSMQGGDGMLCGKPCSTADESFKFIMQPA